MRAVVEAAGIRDILSKSLGSTNPVNVARATIEALRNLHSARGAARARRGRATAQRDQRPAVDEPRGGGRRCPLGCACTLRKSPISYTAAGARHRPRARPAPHRPDRRGRRRPGHARAWSAPSASSSTSRRCRPAGAAQGDRPGATRRRAHEAPRSAAGARLAPPSGRASAAASRPARARPPAAARRARRPAPAAAIPAWFEGGQTPIHVRVPKLHGFKNRFQIEYEVVNVGRISDTSTGPLRGSEAAMRPPGSAWRPRARRDGQRRAAARRRPHRHRCASRSRSSATASVTGRLFIVADAFTKSAPREDRGSRRHAPRSSSSRASRWRR